MDTFTAWRVAVQIGTVIMVGAVVVDMARNGIATYGTPWNWGAQRRDRRRLTDLAAAMMLSSFAAVQGFGASHYIRNGATLPRTPETTMVTILLGVAAISAAGLWIAARVERHYARQMAIREMGEERG